MKIIEGGITAPKGFRASGLHCGVKAGGDPDKKDLAIIVSDCLCAAAGTFTTNKVKAAPVYLSMKNVADGEAQAIVCNSGNANACAPKGEENALKMCEETAKALGLDAEKVLVGSTGVIGHTINIDAITKGIPEAAAALSYDGGEDAAHAIMTTDTVEKIAAVEFEIGGKTARLGGIAKGSGMIHPNMGTMLCFLTTDAAVEKDVLKKILKDCVSVTFNRVSVDGDTSTNDTCLILANGMAGNEVVAGEGADYDIFKAAVKEVCQTLAIKIAKDGEGATKLMTCSVKGAENEEKALGLAMSINKSPLVKTAIFGSDANWGRVLCAMGYSGEDFDPEKVDVAFASKAGTIEVCKNGRGLDFDEDIALKVLSEDEIVIDVTLREGSGEAVCWGCDLTYDYVKINGDYRT